MDEKQVAQLRVAIERFGDTAAPDAKQAAASVLAFIERCSSPSRRSTREGHLTASGWVVDRTFTHALLILHRKLNRWLQPGGHIEDADVSWRAAAQREVTEETGLTAFIAQLADAEIFDMDVHPIPERHDEPAHIHYDIRYLFVADVDATVDREHILNADEAHDCRWIPLAGLALDPAIEPSLRRMVGLSMLRG